jgi:DNA-directed RNA polymerase subunit RPC12/RpoP
VDAVSTYECARCHRVFVKAWTDEEARVEQIENGWTPRPGDAMVCDDCYRAMIAVRPPPGRARTGE